MSAAKYTILIRLLTSKQRPVPRPNAAFADELSGRPTITPFTGGDFFASGFAEPRRTRARQADRSNCLAPRQPRQGRESIAVLITHHLERSSRNRLPTP